MWSIAESLPPELLKYIFQFVQDEYRSSEEEDASYQRYVPLRIPFFSDSRKPSLREKRKFGQLRLVSQSWKVMADIFLFGDVSFSIGSAASWKWDDVYYSMEHRFLETMCRGKYMSLVRSVHLELTLFGDENARIPRWESNRLWAFITLICHLLCQHSCRYIRITSISFSEHCFHRGVQHTIINTITDALKTLPRGCVVEFSARCPKRLIACPTSYEVWFSTEVPKQVATNLSSLEIVACTDVISDTFFESLCYTKRLHISSSVVLTQRDVYDLSRGINMMPALEDLSIDFPVSPLPKTLLRLHLTSEKWDFPSPEFFSQLSQMDALHDLRLGFFTPPPNTRRTPRPIISFAQLSQVTNPQLPNLRVFHVSTDRASKMVQVFCWNVLRRCSALEDVKLSGVGLTNDVILGTVTRSLRNLALDSVLRSETDQEIETGLEQRFEEIQWKSLCTLFQRNPGVSQVHLSFDLGLAPLTYASIHSMSKLCPRLKYVEIFVDFPDPRRILETGYGVDVYSGGSHHQNGIIKGVIVLTCGIENGEYSFIVDLRVFRRLKEAQVQIQKLGLLGSIDLDLEEEIDLSN